MQYTYEAPRGYFRQNEPLTDLSNYDYSVDNFGLIDRDYDTDVQQHDTQNQWQRLEAHLGQLQAAAEPGVKYKLFYWARHGQGEHNAFMARIGHDDWVRTYCTLPELQDAHLTDLGKSQAQLVSQFLASQFSRGMPVPQSFYVSPLWRCLQTADTTWSSLSLPKGRTFDPLIVEGIRERTGRHTCDKHSTRSEIAAGFPHWRIEDGFPEQDDYFDPEHRESEEVARARLMKAIDRIFQTDDNLFISLTIHCDAIFQLLKGVGHNPGALPTGSIIPLVIKATKISSGEEGIASA